MNLILGEAIGAIRTSIQQMSIGIERLRKTLSNIEIETANVLKEATSTNEQHRVRLFLFT